MNRYLQQETLYPPLISRRPSPNLEYVIVIPALREEFVLLNLRRLEKCILPPGDGEVLLLLNQNRQADSETRQINQRVYLQLLEWTRKVRNPRLKFFVQWLDDLPAQYEGPGLARKIGMDEACYRLAKARSRSGWILVMDADIKAGKHFIIDLYQQAQQSKRAILIPHVPFQLQGIDQSDQLYQAAARMDLTRWYRREILNENVLEPQGALWIPRNIYQKMAGLRSFNTSDWQLFLDRAKQAKISVRAVDTSLGERVPRWAGRCSDGAGRVLRTMAKIPPSQANPIGSKSGRNASIEELVMEVLEAKGAGEGTLPKDPVKLMLHCRKMAQCSAPQKAFLKS
ncbi:MAG: hypothetical protein AAGH79_15525 [Bacteroidota bacterium]